METRAGEQGEVAKLKLGVESRLCGAMLDPSKGVTVGVRDLVVRVRISLLVHQGEAKTGGGARENASGVI